MQANSARLNSLIYVLGVAVATMTATILPSREGSAAVSPDGPLVPVVVSVDYPDIYGSIELHVTDAGSFHLSEAGGDCKSPTFWAPVGSWKFGALSEKMFYWSGELEVEGDDACVHIQLHFEELSTLVLGVSIESLEVCYPIEVRLEAGPFGTRTIGSVSKGGFDEEAVRSPNYSEEVSKLIETAREGMVTLWGSGLAGGDSMYFLKPATNDCPPLQNHNKRSGRSWGWKVLEKEL